MSQMRQRWKKRRSGEDGAERKGAEEAETMAGDGGWGWWKKRVHSERQKGRGKREAKMGVSERRRAKSGGLLMRSASSRVSALGWAAGATQQNQSAGPGPAAFPWTLNEKLQMEAAQLGKTSQTSPQGFDSPEGFFHLKFPYRCASQSDIFTSSVY